MSERWGAIGNYFGIFVLILIFLQLSHVAFSKREIVFNKGFEFSPADGGKEEVSAPFELAQGLANVEFDLEAPVTNDWFELEMSLVNDTNGDSFEVEHGVEYYFGSDSDGSWSEGATRGQKLLSSVPSGKYHLQLKPKAGAVMSGKPFNYRLAVTRDVPAWSNFWLALTLISLFPAVVWWRKRAFEVERWSTSDYSPYHQEDDSDDE